MHKSAYQAITEDPEKETAEKAIAETPQKELTVYELAEKIEIIDELIKLYKSFRILTYSGIHGSIVTDNGPGVRLLARDDIFMFMNSMHVLETIPEIAGRKLRRLEFAENELDKAPKNCRLIYAEGDKYDMSGALSIGFIFDTLNKLVLTKGEYKGRIEKLKDDRDTFYRRAALFFSLTAFVLGLFNAGVTYLKNY